MVWYAGSKLFNTIGGMNCEHVGRPLAIMKIASFQWQDKLFRTINREFDLFSVDGYDKIGKTLDFIFRFKKWKHSETLVGVVTIKILCSDIVFM